MMNRCALAFCLIAIIFLTPTVASWAEFIVAVDSAGRRHIVDTRNPGEFGMPLAKNPPDKVETEGLTWNITYADVDDESGEGFDDPVLGQARRDAVKGVLEYISDVIKPGTDATVDVRFLASVNSEDYLAAAGTYFTFRSGFQGGYLHRHILTGNDPSSSVPDVFCEVSFSTAIDWYTGTGQQDIGQYDFFSVMLHELTHGLGFYSLANYDGESIIGPGIFTLFDDFLVSGDDVDLYQITDGEVFYGKVRYGEVNFWGNVGTLTGGDNGVFLSAPETSLAYGGDPKIYAPYPWEAGSSIAHWDESLTGDWLMKPGIPPETTIRTYHLVELAVLRDLGYDVGYPPVADFEADPTVCNAPLEVQFTDLSTYDPTEWEWDFDNDGVVDSTEQNPLHTYTVPGTYSVSLTVSNAYGTDSKLRELYIEVFDPLEANFEADPQSGDAPLAVQFTDLSTGDPDAWEWDFDNDGIVDSVEQHPLHTYTSSGIYTVSLTVSNSCGSDTLTRPLYISVFGGPCVPPVADFTADPTSGTRPLTVEFTDLSTGSPTAWEWDFENDGTVDSYLQNPMHTYPAAGTYSVSLTVHNACGNDTLVRNAYITVSSSSGTPPVANFTATPLAGNAPLMVQFTDESTGSPFSWAWDFDNNGTIDSVVPNPAQVYTDLDAHSVRLTVTNAHGSDTRLRSFYIRVYGPRAVAWMDFAYAGIALGTETQPFALFSEAIDALDSGGTLQIKGDTSQSGTAQTPIITKPMRIEAVNGPVRIGAP